MNSTPLPLLSSGAVEHPEWPPPVWAPPSVEKGEPSGESPCEPNGNPVEPQGGHGSGTAGQAGALIDLVTW